MTDTASSPATASLIGQYIASRSEAAAARTTADQFTARAARADANAAELAAAIVALGGEIPDFPPPVDDTVGDTDPTTEPEVQP